ncbi:MAG TPA: choice-of-anchor D domain-containing protein [Ilumatobacteraceae bacterium]|nr:choice-of-anchor D domain-containing protein [Ilumatobacteraceae bacterium]
MSVVIEQATPTDGPSVGDSIGSGSGSNASLSGDGRFVAYQALPSASDDAAAPVDVRATTIFLTDREAGRTAEVTTVPEGQRSGNSVHPVLSGDGCSIVVITEMALDVFRDDDTADRWDVYRLQLPHCGGTLGAWELVSTRPDGSGLARDDVSTVDTPAVSRSGTLIAYTHPASQSIDEAEVTSVSLVNLEVPVTDPARSALVAGTPIITPNTQFVHVGLDQPAISGDGRFVAYRSDAASADAVPGWGTGAAPGGQATRQVYVWDRNESDPFLAVRLVSVRVDGEPTVVGASDPVLSRDGRVVAFTSADVGLVPAVLPACGGGCPTQVFRLDRDIDANGIYDEVSRTSLTMVSSVEGSDPVVAGTASSSQPALSAEGQLVAFITKAANLQLVEASGGGEADDGDMLVADAARKTLRRIAVTADGVRPTVAAHSRPQLSDTGRTTAFDTLAGPQLVAGGVSGRQVVAVSTQPTLSMAEADVGSTLVGFTSDEYFVAVINNGPTTFTPSTVKVSNGRFVINPNEGTCVLGAPVPPGADCTVRLSFTPDAPGPVSATLTVAEAGFDAVSISSTVRGTGGDPALRANPGGKDLGSVVIGQVSSEFLFDVENISLAPTSVSSVEVEGANPADFAITSNSCDRRTLNPLATCTVGVTFSPTGSGHRTALVKVATPLGQYTTMLAGGVGRYDPVFQVAVGEVQAGGDLGVGGSGFPPNTPVSILFGDHSADALIVSTNADGGFLVWMPVDPTERGGQRPVVAQAADGSAASATVKVIELPSSSPGLPGFGLGF